MDAAPAPNICWMCMRQAWEFGKERLVLASKKIQGKGRAHVLSMSLSQ
jgi:hypothetical protein